MSFLPRAAAAATVVAVAAASPAAADWTPPTTLSTADEANPIAQGAFGGSVVLGWFEPTAAVSKRLGPPAEITAADPHETVWAGRLDAKGNAVVLTVRRHKPVRRVRAIFVSADGERSRARTISDRSHTATGPVLSVAPDGTAVAAWAWHDPKGWRAQAAIRRPGEPGFGKPQTISTPAEQRPHLRVAAGDGGRAVVTWQHQPGRAHVLSAGPDGTLGNDQELPASDNYADIAVAVGADGAVQLAYLGGRSLRVTQGTAGQPLPEPAVLSTGGKGTSSGEQVATAFSADGSATVAWAKPGSSYEQGGTLEVFTRAAGGPFGGPQTLGEKAQGIQLAGGPGNAAALAWMTDDHVVYAATRASGEFAPAARLSPPGPNALWPSIAMTDAGKAIAVWVTNTGGGGSGSPTAAMTR